VIKELQKLLGVGAWCCPLCGLVFPSGFYFKHHLQHGKDGHSLTSLGAWAVMLRLCRETPVYPLAGLSARLVVPLVSKSALVQADLFDSKIALVRG